MIKTETIHKTPVSNNLGQRLKLIRTLRGLSLNDIKTITGISSAYICRLEKGNRENISISVLYKLSKFYNISVDELMKLAGYDTDCLKAEKNLELTYFAEESDYILINGKKINRKLFMSTLNKLTKLLV